jgi:UDP-glucuronate 4-epimerase
MKYIKSKFHRACRHHNIKHLVYASSSSIYGNNTKMPLSTSDNVDHPISLYAATKKSNELMAHTYSHLLDLPTTGLRFFTVYGPCLSRGKRSFFHWDLSREMRSKFHREGRPDMALFLFTKAILEDKPIQVFNNGNMVRDFTYVDDIVEGVVRVIDNPPAPDSLEARVSEGSLPAEEKRRQGTTDAASTPQHSTPYKVYNIGNSSPVPLMEYIAAIETTLGKTAQKKFLPMQPGDVPRTEADVTDLVENLGYKPNTPVQKGIERFIEWYKQYFFLGDGTTLNSKL